MPGLAAVDARFQRLRRRWALERLKKASDSPEVSSPRRRSAVRGRYIFPSSPAHLNTAGRPPFILRCCSGPYLSNRNRSSECKNAGPSEALRESPGSFKGSAEATETPAREKRGHPLFRATSEARGVPRAGWDPTLVSGTITSHGLETAPRKLSCSPTKPCTVVRRRRLLTRGCPATMPAAIESSAENL